MADIKFSEFQKATTSKDSDEIAILQDGVNKMIPSPVLESKIINKTVSRVIDQGGASLNVINLKGVVPTYADLPAENELNDAYQVEADGLVYVYTESGFQTDGEGFVVQPQPTGVVEEGNIQAVSGGEVSSFLSDKVGIDFENGNSSPSDRIFQLTEKFPSDVTNLIRDKYGVVELYPSGENYIEELTGSDIGDDTLWRNGFINGDNLIQSGERWYNSVKYYPLRKGKYDFQLFFSGNARSVIYDLNRNPIMFLSKGGGDNYKGSVVVEDDSLLRISHRMPVDGSNINQIYFSLSESIFPQIITTENIKDYTNKSGEIRQIWLDTYRPKRRKPIVTIISDDCHSRNDDWFIPILDEYGVKSTFAVIGQETVDADLGGSSYLNSQRLRELFMDGHDLASHTWTHTNSINSQTDDEVDFELSKTKTFIENITGVECTMFVSPFGARNPSRDNIISRYHKANFITRSATPRNAVPLNNYNLNRSSFDGDDTNFELLWEDRLKPALDVAILNKEWLLFAVHPQYRQYNVEFNPQALERRNELRLLIEYCQANDIVIMTASSAYQYYKNHVNVGLRFFDDKYYQLGMDMTEINVNYFED